MPEWTWPKSAPTTADLGNGRRETTYTLTLQPFDPDTVTLPPLRVACGTDTAETRALVLKVLPVELDSLTTIHPMEGQWHILQNGTTGFRNG